MSTIVTHKPGHYAQVRLENGERILISINQRGIRVSKLWFGMLPVQTIYDRSRKDMVALDSALMTILKWQEVQGAGEGVLGHILPRVLNEYRSVKDVRILFKDV